MQQGLQFTVLHEDFLWLGVGESLFKDFAVVPVYQLIRKEDIKYSNRTRLVLERHHRFSGNFAGKIFQINFRTNFRPVSIIPEIFPNFKFVYYFI